MAGTNTGFHAATFRTGIRFAMNLGTPPATADRLKFYWNDTVTTAAPVDGEGVPFDPTASITRTARPAVSKPCAVEYLDAAEEPTAFGTVIPSKLRVTLLDQDYKAVGDADFVVIGGEKYLRNHEPPSVGLFDVGVHQIVYLAENEL